MPYTPEVAQAVDQYRARTIPVHVSIQATQVVLSQPEMEALLAQAQCIALGQCDCRREHRRCAAPLDVCLTLDETARETMARGHARRVSLAEALQVLRRSHEHGLVHLAYRQGDSKGTEIVCSCCPCCCWFLNALKRFDYHNALAESSFVAAFDPAPCNGCGLCVRRCPFEAWQIGGDGVRFDPVRCFGCGLCVSACAPGAIALAARIE